MRYYSTILWNDWPVTYLLSPQEVKLYTTSAERDLYESLAEIYSIIITIDALEKAYLKDSISEAEYTETCTRLLKQYKSNLADETVARAFGDLESFKREWDMECPRATERLRVGIPATVEQPLHKAAAQGSDADATLVVAATENFITLLDAIKIGLLEKDTLHPLLVEIIQAVNKVTDKDFESKGKIIQWLITLNQMRAAEKLDDDQAREFQFDMEQAYYDLLSALALLTSAPPSWDSSDTEDSAQQAANGTLPKLKDCKRLRVNPEGVTRYLTSIIGSDLSWIHDDDAKEEIWNQTSLRLTERSGRTAMGALSRAFRIPAPSTEADPIELVIHEPALTADNLGLKTWAASYLLSKRLSTLDIPLPAEEKPRVLELGSGTGLVGLAAACVLSADVVLTDLPSIFPNLNHNIQKNQDIIRRNSGHVQGGILDWTEPEFCELFPDDARDGEGSGSPLSTKFPIILAADSLYSAEHPRWLVNTIEMWLSDEASARVIVELPLREAYAAEREDFRVRMKKIGLGILEEGEETGYDDWGNEGDDNALVRCWWSVWGRQSSKGTPAPSKPPTA
ncbi:VPS28-domain-containing protein [Delitschia confertaspora ATCC 74209]|uniref:VPS28-domain-containing protein n=1 Tax=Delitschia confertaspora ATCC 74209 TaxID=1513339 RepID=A0A9P4JQZ3_9PLEO|nr:VPS28-domain-containing protein [Delitschia confertaspora ATCC 74209]